MHQTHTHYQLGSATIRARTVGAVLLGGAIQQVVANVFGIAAGELALRTRGRAKAAFARQVAMYLTHVACGFNLSDVGRIFRRDRKTVAHACMIVEDRREDPEFDRSIELLEAVTRLQASMIPNSNRLSRGGV